MSAETKPEAAGDGRQIRKRRGIFVAVLPLVIFLALAAIFLRQLSVGGASQDIPSALIGKPVPEFTLAPLEGLSENGNPVPGLSTGDLKGAVSVVNVWASWCVPCRVEAPLLEELEKKYSGDSGVRLVGINYKDRTENALRFLGQFGNPFSAIGIDPRGKAAIDWGVYGVPETFIVDRNGMIVHKHVGPLTEDNFESKFVPELEKIIAAGKSAGEGS